MVLSDSSHQTTRLFWAIMIHSAGLHLIFYISSTREYSKTISLSGVPLSLVRKSLMNASRLCQNSPRLHHFKNSISRVTQWTGYEYKEIGASLSGFDSLEYRWTCHASGESLTRLYIPCVSIGILQADSHGKSS